MRKLITGALLATTFLVAAVTGASARNLRIDNFERGIRGVWTQLEFIPAIGATVKCDVTLEGTYTERTIVKRERATLGRITAGEANRCAAPNEARVLRETLPWIIRYRGFTGTLPNITSVRIDLPEARFRIRNEVGDCRSNPETNNPVLDIANITREAGGLLLISTVRADETVSVPLAGGGLCGFATGRLRGTGNVSVLGETAFPKITLI